MGKFTNSYILELNNYNIQDIAILGVIFINK